jgi:anti-sigma-K factor RskA
MLLAADALDPADAAEVRRHLAAGCPQCQAHYAEAVAVMASIPLSLPPSTITPALRQRVLNTLDPADTAPATLKLTAPPARQPFQRPSPWRFSLAGLAAAASIGLLIGAGGLFAYMSPVFKARDILSTELARATDDSDRLRTALSAKDRELARRVSEVVSLQNILEDQTKLVESLRATRDGALQQVQLMSSPTLKVVELAGLPAQPNARALLFFDTATRQSKIVAQTLTPQPAGRTYEVWLITADSKKYPAGTFNTDATGTMTATIDIPAGLLPLAAIAISDEPEGGSPQPTGNIHALGKF